MHLEHCDWSQGNIKSNGCKGMYIYAAHAHVVLTYVMACHWCNDDAVVIGLKKHNRNVHKERLEWVRSVVIQTHFLVLNVQTTLDQVLHREYLL